MAYQTLDAVNTSQGIHMVFVYVNDITSGLFSRLLLFSFFLILAIGSYFAQKRSTGKGDLPSSFAIAGFLTSTAAIIMSFVDGLINTYDIVIVFSATFLFVLWLFMSSNKE